MKPLSKIRQWLSVLASKPKVQIEDYVLEHLLSYHGLIGSGADEQPQFIQLAAAINNAVTHRSAVQLDTALRVPPLWWDEHLRPAFEEIVRKDPEKLEALLIVQEENDAEKDLLASDDWRVRANAAYALVLLSKHNAPSDLVEHRLARALEGCTRDPFKPAFLHLSYALGTLGTKAACKTLLAYLHNPESWFRVDAARALTLFPADEVAGTLLAGLLDYHLLLDYESMVIARAYNIQKLLQVVQAGDADTQEGLCELVLGILQAAKQTVFVQLVEETNATSCLPQLLTVRPIQCSARRIRAVLQLAQCLAAHNAFDHLNLERFVQFRHELTSAEFIKSIKERLTEISKQVKQTANKSQFNKTTLLRASDIRHTIVLIAELRLGQLLQQLVALLSGDFVARDETINTLGQLGLAAAAEPLIKVAQQLVDLEERIESPSSAQPVTESDPAAAKSYWLILRALGNLPHLSSFEFLCRAAADFAPDKRAQAVRSLVKVCTVFRDHYTGPAHPETVPKLDMTEAEAVLKRALGDPSAEVRKGALKGVAELKLSLLLPYVRKSCGAKERSVSEEAFGVFRRLYSQGLSEPVLKELRHGATWSLNSNLRRRYAQLVASLAG